MEEYVPLPPHRGRSDYAPRVAAWVCALTPDLLKQAVPELAVRPRACGLVALAVAEATQRARRSGGAGPMTMSAVIPAPWLQGALPEEDAALLRGIELPPDTTSTDEVIEQRIRELRRIGRDLPEHV